VSNDRDILTETKSRLKAHNIHPSKTLGQNFLIDRRIIEELVNYAAIQPTDIILDVGSGLGFLTEALAYRAKRVIATELDQELVKILNERLGGLDNVEVIAGDILPIKLPRFDKVVSAPPYKISSPLVFKILEYRFKIAVLILQKEFAMRLKAMPGTSDYSRLSVMTQLKAEVEILSSVPSEAFYPKPEIASSIVRLSPKRKEPYIIDLNLFENLVRGLFSQRRRRLRKAILPFLKYKLKLQDEQVANLRKTLPMMDRRVFTLAPKEFVVLANTVSEIITVVGG